MIDCAAEALAYVLRNRAVHRPTCDCTWCVAVATLHAAVADVERLADTREALRIASVAASTFRVERQALRDESDALFVQREEARRDLTTARRELEVQAGQLTEARAQLEHQRELVELERAGAERLRDALIVARAALAAQVQLHAGPATTFEEDADARR